MAKETAKKRVSIILVREIQWDTDGEPAAKLGLPKRIVIPEKETTPEMLNRKDTLMNRLLEAGYPREKMYSHESDLYVFVTPRTTAVINKWCEDNGFKRTWHCPIFRDQITGKPMYDCAFCFDDYWKERG